MAPLRGARPKSRAGAVDMSSAIRPSETSRSCSACVANTPNMTSAPLPDPGGIVHTVAPSALGSGAWSLPTAWMRPSRTCSHSRSTEAALRVGGFHLLPQVALARLARRAQVVVARLGPDVRAAPPGVVDRIDRLRAS